MESKPEFDQEACRIISDFGGTNAVARLCDIKPPSVTEWKKTGIPKPWLKYFKAIRPDIFGDARSPGRRKTDLVSGRRKLTGASK